MIFPQNVEITEVGPRDGIQNVHDLVSFDGKVAIIRKMAETGFKRIEAVSFVSPKAIPQMADAKEVFLAVKDDLRKNGVRSVALVPNARGVETAVECGVDEVTYVISVSEQHNMANVRRTPAESMEQFRQLIEQYKGQIDFRLGLVTALGSPFAGEEIRTETVVDMARFGLELGCSMITVADTVGVSDPANTYHVMKALTDEFGPDKFVMHLHNTRGMALANTLACLELGVHHFEAAQRGLDGVDPAAYSLQAVEDTHVAGVVDVGGELGIREGRQESAEHLPHLGGIGHADGITDIELADAHIVELSHEIHQGGSGHAPFKGAAKGGGHIQIQLQLREGVHDAFEFVKGLLVGPAHIIHIVAGAERNYRRHLFQPRLRCQLCSLEVGDQSKGLNIRVLLQHIGRNFGGILHLRDGLGADKAGALQGLDPGSQNGLNDLQLYLRGDHHAADALKPVPGADFYHVHMLAHGHNLLLFMVLSLGGRQRIAPYEALFSVS